LEYSLRKAAGKIIATAVPAGNVKLAVPGLTEGPPTPNI
jgi:hypothetical protein